MRHAAAHDRGVPLPRPDQIVDVLAAAPQKAKIFNPFNRATNESIDVSHELDGSRAETSARRSSG